MKQLKLMVLTLTLLMGTMFTSCMDSGESGPQQLLCGISFFHF